jgi:prepilin-type N-terminal cleavage/methylation domain-containing protein
LFEKKFLKLIIDKINNQSHNQNIQTINKLRLTMKHRAFSLIELSIVILIIGILVAGVTSSSRLIRQIRIQSARNLTVNSPVTSISSLHVWLETTSVNSFSSEQLDDGYLIETWNDINPQSSYKNNALQSTNSQKPIYKQSGLGSLLPVVSFTGSQMMAFANQLLLKPVSYFFVIRPNTIGNEYAVTGTSAYGMGISISSSGYIVPVQQNYNLILLNPPYVFNTILNVNKLNLVYFQYASNGAYSCYSNGVLDCTPTTKDINFVNQTLYLGYNPLSNNLFYNGDIAELIIYNKVLNDEERKSVEKYLTQKWSIK